MSRLEEFVHVNWALFDGIGFMLTIWIGIELATSRPRWKVSTRLWCVVWAAVVGLGMMGTRHELGDLRGIQAARVCVVNEKAISMAALAYSSDWDDRLPGAAQWTSGKLKLMSPYANRESWRCPAASERVGYAFHRRLEGLSLSHLEDPAAVVLLQETDTCGWLSGGSPDCLPREARHNEGDNFAFADGQVRWARRGGPVVLKW